jgi:hypothetical protein
MRLYGKKYARDALRSPSFARDDTKNAILWDVPNVHYCRVKIQGSSEYVIAWFPDAFAKTRGWMIPGIPVRIGHVGGRGRIELLGQGLYIPSPISGDMQPDPGFGGDGVLTGGAIRALDVPRMAVIVEAATYRIDGITYSLTGTGIVMEAASTATMGDGFVMGAGLTDVIEVTLNAAPGAGYYRYDMISVGVDGVVDYTAGTAATSNPVKPTLAANHVLLGDYILVYGGMTQVTTADIGRIWTAPYAASLTATPADADLAWAELSTSITLQVRDQYGQPFSSGSGYYFTLEFMAGNGTLYSSETGPSTASVGGHGSSSISFSYTRDQTSGDLSPAFLAKVNTTPEIPAVTRIVLRDSGGAEM